MQIQIAPCNQSQDSSSSHRLRHRTDPEEVPNGVNGNTEIRIRYAESPKCNDSGVLHNGDRDTRYAERLQSAGAVILGKTNLSEWANFRSTRSTSGWSSRGGQTKNPYALDRNPCGSSAGSGAAASALRASRRRPASRSTAISSAHAVSS